jgi:hypothetical protein
MSQPQDRPHAAINRPVASCGKLTAMLGECTQNTQSVIRIK